jgi:Kef-type K+ transport system membrane component KefB
MTSIVITICLLLLLAYVFDVSAARTKIPAVVLLLLLGWAVRQLSDFLGLVVPNLSPVLPALGTIGLILIVLEGALELELNRGKLPLVGKSSLMAILPMLALALALAWLFSYYGETDFKIAFANAIPLAVISSSVAIPSAQHLSQREREFVTYESSLSDIFGVLLFNFVTLNESFDLFSVGSFVAELLVILLVTFGATLGLSYLLSQIRHHVKFAPIVLMIILIYFTAKIYHLPSLVFILFFGLFLQNLDELRHIKFIDKLHPDVLNKEVSKFKEFIVEATFLIRALFFLLFGFLIKTDELLNSETIVWAVVIVAAIFAIRYAFVKLIGLKALPLAFIAPRGLITIVLFLSIPIGQQTPLVNNSLVIQVIILSALVMMAGLMADRKRFPDQGAAL